MLSRRVRNIGSSPTLRISAQAQEMQAAGIDVLDFGVGEPDFPTPEPVCAAGRRAIDEQRTRYTANAGIAELRRAVADRLGRDHGIPCAPDRVLVSPGAKASLYFAFQALCDPGDHVLLPAPYWVSYPEQIRLAEAEPVVVPTHEAGGFRVRAADLEAALTPRTRGLVLNDPSNPTGASCDREELEAIADLCVRRELWVVSDEIYARLLYDGRTFSSIASLGAEIAARTVSIGGASKTYGMTGWRIGFAVGPAEVVSAMARIQSHSTSNATSISQWAVLEALTSDAVEVEFRRRVAEFERRRDVIVDGLGDIDGFRCPRPDGAFYVFPNVEGLLGRGAGDTDAELAAHLLERARVAVVPGEAFGAPGHLRLSYAVSVERIREGLARIADALAALPER